MLSHDHDVRAPAAEPTQATVRPRTVTATPVYVAGTGNFAAEGIEFACAAGFEVLGLLEPTDPKRVGRQRHGLPVHGLQRPPEAEARVAIGVGGDRAELADRLEAAGWHGTTIVHPTAYVSQTAHLEAGVVVGPMGVVGAHTEVRAHALLGRGVLVGHHANVGVGCSLNPGANVGGLAASVAV
jgi:hypothetical protein